MNLFMFILINNSNVSKSWVLLRSGFWVGTFPCTFSWGAEGEWREKKEKLSHKTNLLHNSRLHGNDKYFKILWPWLHLSGFKMPLEAQVASRARHVAVFTWVYHASLTTCVQVTTCVQIFVPGTLTLKVLTAYLHYCNMLSTYLHYFLH